MSIGIYKITSPSSKIYIGQSKQLRRRFKSYERLECKGQIALYGSFLKYGFDKHLFEVIEKCDIDSLNQRERYWQDFYDVLKYGLNCELQRTHDKPKVFSEKSRLKMSKSLKGRIITKEWRENLSKAGKGRKPSKKSIQKTILRCTGVPRTQEVKDKISKNHALSKIVLDMEAGVFYNSITELSLITNIKYGTLSDRLTGRKGYTNNSQYKIV